MTRRILVVSPHPDDESLGCGGALCKHVSDGDEVQVIFLTSGEQGGHGRTPEETQFVREREAVEAAKVIGINNYEFWREPDGELKISTHLVDRLLCAIVSYVPDRIYVTHDKEEHNDHKVAAQLVKMVVADLIENVPEILMYEIWTPMQKIDEIIDISLFIDTKLTAIRAYESQCEVLRFDDAFLGLSRYRGEMFCWPKNDNDGTGEYAEIFQKMEYK